MIDVNPNDLETVTRILAAHVPECEVRAFGSRVTWTAKAYSDLDLAIVCAHALDTDVLGQLKEKFENSNLSFRVDVLDWHSISTSFQKVIERKFAVVQERRDQSLGLAREWRGVRVTDIASRDRNSLVGGPFGSNLVSRDYVERGIPVIRGQNMGERWVSGMFAYVTPAKAQELSGNLAKAGDIIFTQRGTLGQVSLVPEGPHERYLISQSQMKLTVDRGFADPLFFYYLFSSDEQIEYIRQHSIQTGVPHTNLGILRSTPVPLPPIHEQRAIAHILGTLDDKIELNRRMNETLEAMARALFKSWFVDFDPVRSKAERRNVGLTKPVANLFPGVFEESELGEIPKGWGVGTIESLCESITSGGTPARMNPSFWDDGRIPWFKTGELLDGPLIESEEYITDAALAGSSCKLWPAGTILFALYASPTVGRVGILTRPGTSNQAAAGLIAKLEVGGPFLRRLLLQARSRLQAIAVGAAQQNINQRVLKMHRVLIPSGGVTEAYSRLVSPLDDQQIALAKQTRTLVALRDALLPKLISGELRVKDADAIVKDNIA